MCFFFFQAEDGIRDLVRSRGLGDVYKRQLLPSYDPEATGFKFELLTPLDALKTLLSSVMNLDLSLIHI